MEWRIVMEVLEKVWIPEKELDDPEFMKDLRIMLLKMLEVVSIIGECRWPEGVRYSKLLEVRGL